MGRASEELADRLWPDWLQELQDALSRSSEIPILVVDLSGRPLAACEDLMQFCRSFTRAVALRRPCLDCRRYSKPQQSPESYLSTLTQTPELHLCPLGLVDVALPIFCAGEIMGYLISAQVLLIDADEDSGKIESLQMAQESEEHWSLFQRLPRLARVGIKRASVVLSAASWLLSSYNSSRRRNLRLSEQLRAKNRALRELAMTDLVTGVANKRRFMEALEAEIQRARRYHREFTLVALEIEAFRCINEEFGHDVGDAVLSEVARGLLSILRQTDFIGRTAGNGFSVLLPETARHQALVILARIFAVVEDINALGELPVEIKLAVGLADQVMEAPAMLMAAWEEANRAHLELRLG